MNSEKKYIDLDTFKPYERPPQPYIVDANIIRQDFPMPIKQEDFAKMTKHDDDGIYNTQFSSRERLSRYGSNGGGNEQFDPRSQT